MSESPNLRLKLSDEVLSRFRPPLLETVLVAGLRGVQILCLIGSGVAFLTYFATDFVPGWAGGLWLPFAIFGAFMLSFYRGLWLEENFRSSNIALVAAEIVVISVIIRVVGYLVGFASPVITLGYILTCGFIGTGWYMGRKWLELFFYQYLQPWELTEAEGGAPGVQENNRIPHDHSPVYEEIKSNWYWMAGFQVAVVVVGVATVSQYGSTATKDSFSQTLMVFGAIHLLLGLPLMIWARLRYLRTIWKLNRLTEPPRISQRWTLYLVVLTLAALLPAVILSNLSITIPLPLGNSGNANPPPIAQPTPDGTPLPGLFPRPPLPPPPYQEPFVMPVWLGGILIGLASLLFIYLIWLALYTAGFPVPRWRKINLIGGLRGIWLWIKGIFQRGPREGAMEEATRPKSSGFNLFRGFRRDRLPQDARGQVRFHYRHMAERAAKVELARRMSQTPQEYANFINPRLEEPELKPEVDGITSLYEEARFSAHPIDPAQAEQAKEQSDKLIGYFKRKKRGK